MGLLKHAFYPVTMVPPPLYQMLSLDQAMAAWGEGVKEVLEPTIVLLLAWGLGAVIADVSSTNYYYYYTEIKHAHNRNK